MFSKVLLADDFIAFRHYIRHVLMDHPVFEVVAEATDGLMAVQKAEEFQPDVILLDIAMPLMNGFEAARQIFVVSPKSKIVFLTEHESSAMVSHALSLGAHGYLVKSHVSAELLPALKEIALGNIFISRKLKRSDLPDGRDN